MKPATEESALRAEFHDLQEQAKKAAARGQFDVAAALYEEASQVAKKIGDQELIDLAGCNQAALAIHLGQGQTAVRDLQIILMRSASMRNRHLAAYSASHFYDLEEQAEKRIRYAKLALEYAEQLAEPDLIARSHNLLANMLLIDSYFEEAGQHYERALDGSTTPSDAPELLAQGYILANLGYCDLAIGQHTSGFTKLFAALRLWRKLPSRCGSMGGRVHLSLCYGYLELQRNDRARRYGLKALELAEGAGDEDAVRKSLYLLGDVEKAAGDEYSAYEYFHRLQQEFHAENSQLADLLMATDTRNLINLMA